MSAQPEYFITPRIPGVRPKDPPDYDGYVFVYVFTRILDPWLVPPVSGNVDVVVDNSQGFVPGMTIAVEWAGTYQVVDASVLNRLTIQNLNNQNNALPGTTIPPGNLTTTSLPGPKGDKGNQGIQGIAATVDVGTTVTSPAGQNATVVNVGTQNQAVFNFTIPRGPVGPQGPQGAPGQAYNNTTSADFTAADAPTLQTLSLQSTTGLFTGVVLDINPVGYYQIQSVLSGTQVRVVNTMTPGNSAAGTLAPSGSAVLGTGPQGPAGISASITAGNTTTLPPGNAAAVTQRGTQSAAIFDFAIPQGAVGPQGAQGVNGAPGAAGADGVTPTVDAGTTATLSPGQPAAVTQRGSPTAVIFDFAIPQGALGATGPQGATGPTGPTGAPGTAATLDAGNTSTGAPGSNAAVTQRGTAQARIFDFAIPRGDVGAQGPTGPQGATGPTGAQGPKGDLGNEDVGSIKAWPVAAAPASWMLCDGSAISRTLYPALFGVIGTTYGVGDGSTTFNLPDSRGRFVLGFGQGAGLTNRNLADVGGEEAHQLTIGELAVHTHIQNAHSHGVFYQANAASGAVGTGVAGAGTSSGGSTTTNTAVNQNTGSGTPHNTMPPFLVITYIIKVSPTGGATAQAPIADATQAGLMKKLSGLATDYVGGDNASHPRGAAVVGNIAGDPVAPGSIVVPSYKAHPDALWTPMNAFDDHFDGATLDPKWTQFITAAAGNALIETAASELTLTVASTSTNNGTPYVVSATQALLNQTAPFQITTKFNPTLYAAAFSASICYASLRLYSPSNYLVDCRIAASYAPGPPIINYVYCQVYGGQNAATQALLLYGAFQCRYVRFVYGTDRSVTIWVSNNGQSWIALVVVTGATSGFATEIPTRAGLYLVGVNAGRGLISSDWIRFQNL